MESANDFARTWDGLPISKEPPTGTAIVVYRRTEGGLEFLILHRAHSGPDYDGDWAWGPPSGARFPDEPVGRCAERELLEESGLRLIVQPTSIHSCEWPVYVAEASIEGMVILSPEHDRYAWLPIDQAISMVSPELVQRGLAEAAQWLETGNG